MIFFFCTAYSVCHQISGIALPKWIILATAVGWLLTCQLINMKYFEKHNNVPATNIGKYTHKIMFSKA